MKKVFVLSKQDLNLSAQEVLSLADPKRYELVDDILILQTGKKIAGRLAFTRSVYRLLFRTTAKNTAKAIEEFDWQGIYTKDFCLRVNGASQYSEAGLAGLIWKRLEDPKVNLRNPSTFIEMFFRDNTVIAGIKAGDIDMSEIANGAISGALARSKQAISEHAQEHAPGFSPDVLDTSCFESRKPHKRPALHPTSMHPRLARALVNLTGIWKGKILDPFCGSGGILIEAGMMGLKPVGYDISREMLGMAETNLKHYRIKDFILEQRDALKITSGFDYIVTDLPYGRQGGKISKALYPGFIKNLRKILRKRAVIVFPSSYNYTPLLKKNKLEIEHEFTWYVHRSLSRKIVVVKAEA